MKFGAIFGRDLRPDRWIFVVGCYNSGTTLLARILSEHAAIAGMPDEGVFYTDVLPHPERFGWTRMWHRCYHDIRLEPGDLAPADLRRIRKQWSWWFDRRCPNLVEKSVVNSARIPFMDEAFQPAYFIYIIRDGYAVAEGIRRRAKPGKWGNPEFRDRYPLTLCVRQWLESHRVVQRDLATVARAHFLKYEDLVANPRLEMDRVTEFLGLDPIDIDLARHRWKFQGVDSTIDDRNREAHERLTEDDIDTIEGEAGDVLRLHGYERPGSAKS